MLEESVVTSASVSAQRSNAAKTDNALARVIAVKMANAIARKIVAALRSK